MADYRFDRVIELPHGNFASFEHMAFSEACSNTVNRFNRLDAKNRIEYDFVADDQVRIYGNGNHAETVFMMISEIAKEFFTKGASLTFENLTENFINARDLADKTYEIEKIESKTSAAKNFFAAVADPQAAASPGHTLSKSILGDLKRSELSARQKKSLHALMACLSDHDIQATDFPCAKLGFNLSAAPEKMEVAEALIKWSFEEMSKQKDLSEHRLDLKFDELMSHDTKSKKQQAIELQYAAN